MPCLHIPAYMMLLRKSIISLDFYKMSKKSKHLYFLSLFFNSNIVSYSINSKFKKILHFISCLYIKSKRPLFKATQAKKVKFNYEEKYLLLHLTFFRYLSFFFIILRNNFLIAFSFKHLVHWKIFFPSILILNLISGKLI